MAKKKRRPQDEEAWKNAKKLCRLNVRQIEMARALGMNPKKLPALRPSPQERWKMPVGRFIEACCQKRFGGETRERDGHGAQPHAKESSTARQAGASKRVQDPLEHLADLVCYLENLAEDVEQWLEHGAVARDVLAQVGAELRQTADALDNGAPIFPMSAIPVPPRAPRSAASRRGHRELQPDDDDIPF